jgi:hypothetical protein
MITFDEFRREWETHRVGDDSLVRSGEESNETKYQCVSLVKQYLRECFNIEPGAWGNAVDYWTSTNPTLLPLVARIQNSDTQTGDIVVLWGLPGNSYGHIGIATGNSNSTQVEILEQNGSTGGGTGLGNDAIRTRFVDRSRVAGLLRPVAVPVRTPKDYMQYTAVPTKVMRTNKVNTNWWNLSNDSNNIDNFQPAAVLTVQSPFTIGGYAKNLHFPDFTYAMTPDDFQRAINGDYSTNNGINLTDLDELPPAPYIPPAAPVSLPKVTYYTVLPDVIKTYATADDAKRDNPTGVKAKGVYIELARDGMAVKLVKSNTEVNGDFWVNNYENKIDAVPVVPTLPVDPPPAVTQPVDVSDNSLPEPLPSPAVNWEKPITHSMNPDGSPVYFHAMNQVEIDIPDLQTGDSLPMSPYNDGKLIPITQWLEYNGMTYYRPQKVAKAGWWNCIRADLLQEADNPKAFDFNHDDKVNLQDIGYIIQDYIVTPSKRAYTKATELGLVDKAVHVTNKVQKRVIDGFTKGKR